MLHLLRVIILRARRDASCFPGARRPAGRTRQADGNPFYIAMARGGPPER